MSLIVKLLNQDHISKTGAKLKTLMYNVAKKIHVREEDRVTLYLHRPMKLLKLCL